VAEEDRADRARERGWERQRYPSHRGFVIGSLRAGRRSFPVHGVLELDVTDAVAALDRQPEPLSFTAFVVAATARAVSAHPQVHAYRDWRGRLVVTHHVDVATLIEVADQGTTFPLAHLIRDADVRPVRELSAELRDVKADVGQSESGRLLRAGTAWVGRFAGLARMLYAITARSPRLREKSGTVAVTSVGMFGKSGGIGIGQPTIMTLSVVVGGRSMRPRVVDGQIVPRLVLDLTISVDHAIVDGAPAARFAATLIDLIEHPAWIDTPAVAPPGPAM
jgi:pyruvate/2-oxoglutarate dehydrogenase complex dihydrolipoamide acyltransferase (E2) component